MPTFILAMKQLFCFYLFLFGSISNSLISEENLLNSKSSIRLRKDVIPIEYNLHIKIYLPSDFITPPLEQLDPFKFLGNVSIIIRCDHETNFVTLHSKNLNLFRTSLRIFRVDSISRQTLAEVEIDINQMQEFKSLEQIRISLREYLKLGKYYIIYLNYEGFLNHRLFGFYKSLYKENNKTKWLAATHFQPTFTRYALPCFDEPEFKSVFKISIIHPADMKALSNGMEDNREETSDGWAKTSFKPSPRMSSYLLAFVVADFAQTSTNATDGNVTFRIWSRPTFQNYCYYALETGKKILRYFEETFNTPFPLDKIDIVALPDFNFAAMENYGLIMFREMELFIDKSLSPYFLIRRTTEVLAHELAHQWFGNLVTMNWWSDLWLNEGFSVYTQYYGAKHIIGSEYRINENFFMKSLNNALEFDGLETTHPLYSNVQTMLEIMQTFDKVTYDKGATIVRMFNNVVGNHVFLKIVQKYFQTFRFDTVDHVHMYETFTETLKKDGTVLDWDNKSLNVSTFLTPWTSRKGYPLINVHRNLFENTVTLSQTKFVQDFNRTAEGKWYIPIVYEIQGWSRKKVWLTPESNLTLGIAADNWFLLNYDNHAYLRTNYDLFTWNLFLNQLLQDHRVLNITIINFSSFLQISANALFLQKIPSINRAQLIDDAFTLTRIGKLPYQFAFSMLDYMPKETNLVVWTVMFNHMKWINERLIETKYKSFVEKYYQRLIDNVKTRIKSLTSEQAAESDFLRAVLMHVACEINFSNECDNVNKMLQKYFRDLKVDCLYGKLNSKCNKIPASMKQAVYCSGIAASNSTSDYDFLWSKYLLEDFAAEKMFALYGLSCTTNMLLYKILLNHSAMGIDISVPDSGYVFSFLSFNKVGYKIIWDYVRTHWNQMMSRFELSASLNFVVTSATYKFSTVKELEELETFLERNGNNLGISKLLFEQMLERTKFNVAWVNKFLDDVPTWLPFIYNIDNV